MTNTENPLNNFERKHVGKDIIILGAGHGWDICPYDKETWTLNMQLFKVKRVDRLFLTDPIEYKTDIQRGFYFGTYEKKGEKIPVTVEDFKKKLEIDNVPFVSAYRYDDIKTYEPYPIKEVIYGFNTPYFANTVSYMIAYAILHGVKNIDLWGINQAHSNEYLMHKGCVEFWLGMAAGAGVNININGPVSHVLRNPDDKLYGYRMTLPELAEQIDKHGPPVYHPLKARKKAMTHV